MIYDNAIHRIQNRAWQRQVKVHCVTALDVQREDASRGTEMHPKQSTTARARDAALFEDILQILLSIAKSNDYGVLSALAHVRDVAGSISL